MNLDQAIQLAKKEVKDPNALVYLNAIPKAIEGWGSEGLESQIMYALCNMKSWRGENARQAKLVMNNWLKEFRKNAQASMVA